MDRPAALEASLVQEFVGVAHSDLNRVTELLAQEPSIEKVDVLASKLA